MFVFTFYEPVTLEVVGVFFALRSPVCYMVTVTFPRWVCGRPGPGKTSYSAHEGRLFKLQEDGALTAHVLLVARVFGVELTETADTLPLVARDALVTFL